MSFEIVSLGRSFCMQLTIFSMNFRLWMIRRHSYCRESYMFIYSVECVCIGHKHLIINSDMEKGFLIRGLDIVFQQSYVFTHMA